MDRPHLDDSDLNDRAVRLHQAIGRIKSDLELVLYKGEALARVPDVLDLLDQATRKLEDAQAAISELRALAWNELLAELQPK